MTRTITSCFAVLVLTVITMAPRAAHAAQSYDNCTGFITSLPAVISTQGTWCLKQDLATAITSGNAIDIQTNNVTLDCNDFKLGGLAAGLATTAIGVHTMDHVNLTVRHCNIRGFFAGVLLTATTASSGGGHLVEDNRFDGNTSLGIGVKGDGSVIRRNRVFDTGGSTAFADAYGIATGYSTDILDNIVAGVLARSGGGGNAYGIDASANTSGRISGNGVHDVVKDGSGIAKGIYNTGSDRISLRDNDVVGDGSTGSAGLTCTNANGSARDNVISNFITGIDTCTDSGGNSILP